MNAFAVATNAMFTDPNHSHEAIWSRAGVGGGIVVRVIRRAADEIGAFGEAQFLSDTTLLDLRTSEPVTPASGDVVTIDGETFTVQGTPHRDADRLVWTVEARPTP